ncbi:hypothetical protein KY289_007913 [Solanum tuberosum]|nr:hypothetical protein KY289_007913 [Solanum tuberosum]
MLLPGKRIILNLTFGEGSWMLGMIVNIIFFGKWAMEIFLFGGIIGLTEGLLLCWWTKGPSKCFCCHNGMNEDINHLFSYGQIAEKVWKFFEHTLGLLWPNSDSIRTKLMRWWRIKSTNKVLELTTQCLPSVIYWDLWKHRCTYKYEGTKIYSGNIIHQATYHIHLILTSQFPSLKLPTKF